MLTEKLDRYGSFGTHDALKLIGLALMVFDHTGLFAFPDAGWWRLIGRAAAPIFFFLIGYSKSYHFHFDILFAAILLAAVDLIGERTLTLPNILFSFIIVRFLLAAADKRRWMLKYPWLVFLILLFLWPFSWNWFEYGTLGFMFSLFGYMQKRPNRFSALSRKLMLIATFIIYEFTSLVATVPEQGVMGFLFLTAVLISCGLLLWYYRPRALRFPRQYRRFELACVWPARYSLWIYTLHLAVLHVATGVYF